VNRPAGCFPSGPRPVVKLIEWAPEWVVVPR
jgi:hypothetical protein